ncbi:hypothetical protein [Clostridium tarantellae]|uniref:Uncharacterized protein n=1 Tax=Clostridium tarantellae TaxID=39493 RepID=A0A6I1MV54_9CLOT|nr:hypothetical protein [Clostridium tarantellae]MPQ44731.1 hypothetical protein [Clostridium tarantellae]
MNNNFKYENDSFKLVPLDLPDNCKGTFITMTNNDFEIFKPNSISQFQTLHQPLNMTRLNNLNENLINSSNETSILNSNFSAVKSLMDKTNTFENLNANNNILVKTLVVVKKSTELFN